MEINDYSEGDGEDSCRAGPGTQAMEEAGHVKALRREIDLTQKEFGRLLGVKPLTIAQWEKEGLKESRGGAHNAFLAVDALLKQAEKTPSFLDPSLLRKFLNVGARGGLEGYFLREMGNFESGFLKLIKSGHLLGVLAAYLYHIHRQKGGEKA